MPLRTCTRYIEGLLAVKFYLTHAIVYLPEDRDAPVWRMIDSWCQTGHEVDRGWLEIWASDRICDLVEIWKIDDIHISNDGSESFLRMTDGIQPMPIEDWYELYGM